MMKESDYFKKVDVIAIRTVALISPLLLWIYIWYNWGGLSDFNVSLKEQKKRLTKRYIAAKMGINVGQYWHIFNYSLLIMRRSVFTFALIIPFLYVIINFWPLLKGWRSGTAHDLKAKPISPLGETTNASQIWSKGMGICVNPCFKKVTSKKLKDIGIVGTLDLKCQNSSNYCVSNTLQSIITAANIISLCIFLLVLLIYRQIPSAWDKRKSLNHWVIISLMIGFIIQHMSVWEMQSWLTYWIGFSASILLAMNISAFIIIISLISTQVFFEFF